MTASPRALPNLLIIGAMKSGTSSLHSYLAIHPEIQMSDPKELHFFIDAEGFDPSPFIADPREAALFGEVRTWDCGVDWYSGYFDPAAAVRGESTVAYTFPWYQGVVDRIADTVGDARLIYVVRDPVERTVSHYHQFRAGGPEWRKIEDAISRPDCVYVGPTRYATILERYLERFPRERIYVLRQDELLSNRRRVLGSIFRFLGVDDSFFSEEMDDRLNRSDVKWSAARHEQRSALTKAILAPTRLLPSRARTRLRRLRSVRPDRYERPEASDELRTRLITWLEPEISGLEKLAGMDLADWRRHPADHPASTS
jgi:hypothetical protein